MSAVILQLIIILFLCKNKDVRNCLCGMLAVLILNYIQMGTPDYYIRCFFYDILFILCSFCLLDKAKRLIIISICSLSAFMNIYEHIHFYQSIIYQYRDITQWIMVEAMILTVIWKCQWRGFNANSRQNY